MEQQDQQNVCNHIGSNNPDYCSEKSTCQDSDRCRYLWLLEKLQFRKFGDPPAKHEHLFEPLLEAWDEAAAKYPGDNKRMESLIISRLKKANEAWARAKESESRGLRQEADRRADEAAAIRRSEPKGPGRFPFGWMRDVSKESRGAMELLNLLTLVKEIAKPISSHCLIDEMVASGRFTREELAEHYVDKKGKERSWPVALFQMDYQLAQEAKGWKKDKVRRLLRLACKAGVIQDMGKSPPDNGQMVYCAGYWLTIKGISFINWLFKGTDYWIDVFRNFKCT